VAVYASLADTRGTAAILRVELQRLLGMKVLRSTDLGKTFKETKSAPAFQKEDGARLANIWSLEAATTEGAWCGVEPAALFKSATVAIPGRWSGHQQPHHARKWQPGNGGLSCTRSCATEIGCTSASRPAAIPERGCGETCAPANKGVGAGFLPIPSSSLASACTKCRLPDAPAGSTCKTMVAFRSPARVLRSDDHGHTGIHQQGTASDFGLPIVVHPHDADTDYVCHSIRRRAPVRAARRRLAQRERRASCRSSHRAAEKGELLHVLRDAVDIDESTSPRSTSDDHRTALDRPAHEEKGERLSTRSADPLRKVAIVWTPDF